MIAFDCLHEAHENAQFTAATRKQLTESVLRRFDHYHTKVSEEQVNDLVNANAYDPERRPHNLRATPSFHGGRAARDGALSRWFARAGTPTST
jgi:hypothetical protein